MTSRSEHLAATASVGTTLGAAYAGFTIGAVLYGMSVTQVYAYFVNGCGGSNWQKATVIIIMTLDSLHFAFSIHMLFCYLLNLAGNPDFSWTVWSLKGLGSTQVFFIVYVQGLYLYKMWYFSKNRLLSKRFRHGLKAFTILLSFLAIGVGVLFLVELQKVEVISSFTLEFEYVIYVGFGTTALIDMGIAAAMCLMLHKSSGGITRKTNMIVTTLIQYIVGTGLLTSFGALLCMILYIAKPMSLLYLGVEYSSTRLYAISVFALYNSQARLRNDWNEPQDLKGSSALYFAEPPRFAPNGQIIIDGVYRDDSSDRTRRRTSSLPSSPNGTIFYPTYVTPMTSPTRIVQIPTFHDQERTLVQNDPYTPVPLRRPPPRYSTA